MIKEIILLENATYTFAGRTEKEIIGYAIIEYSDGNEGIKPISFGEFGNQITSINGYSLQNFFSDSEVKVTDKRTR